MNESCFVSLFSLQTCLPKYTKKEEIFFFFFKKIVRFEQLRFKKKKKIHHRKDEDWHSKDAIVSEKRYFLQDEKKMF